MVEAIQKCGPHFILLLLLFFVKKFQVTWPNLHHRNSIIQKEHWRVNQGSNNKEEETEVGHLPQRSERQWQRENHQKTFFSRKEQMQSFSTPRNRRIPSHLPENSHTHTKISNSGGSSSSRSNIIVRHSCTEEKRSKEGRRRRDLKGSIGYWESSRRSHEEMSEEKKDRRIGRWKRKRMR